MRNFIIASVYAGLLANLLGIAVCLLFHSFDEIIGPSLNLAIWTFSYYIHKNAGNM